MSEKPSNPNRTWTPKIIEGGLSKEFHPRDSVRVITPGALRYIQIGELDSPGDGPFEVLDARVRDGIPEIQFAHPDSPQTRIWVASSKFISATEIDKPKFFEPGQIIRLTEYSKKLGGINIKGLPSIVEGEFKVIRIEESEHDLGRQKVFITHPETGDEIGLDSSIFETTE